MLRNGLIHLSDWLPLLTSNKKDGVAEAGELSHVFGWIKYIRQKQLPSGPLQTEVHTPPPQAPWDHSENAYS